MEILLFFILSFTLTACIKYFLKKFKVLDFPNERGMHRSIVPRGGGLAIVFSLILFFVLNFYSSSNTDLYYHLTLFILIFAAIGFLDDLFSISYKPRLLVQFIGTIYLIFLSSLADISPSAEVFFISGFALKFTLVILFVWFINLFNFMDGIDGLATTQAICFFLCSAFLLSKYEYQYPVQDFLIYISILCGFLLWNFHKAKIFLGDVGSTTLSILIGIYILYFLGIDSKLFYAGIILMALFIVDATYTLIIRIFRNQSFHSAHNSHAYQNFARKLNSHSLVTCICILINLFFLFPIANLLFMFEINPIILVICSYVPLLIGCIYLKAGTSISNQ
jgi:Fuc2NAc and GlcNAc transferase